MSNGSYVWKVDSVTPFTDFTAGMGAVEGSRINFTTSKGIVGFVFVATAQLGDTDAIANLINDRVIELHAVANLTG